MKIANFRNRLDNEAIDRRNNETRIAAELQKHGMTRTEALREAYRIVNGYPSPCVDPR